MRLKFTLLIALFLNFVWKSSGQTDTADSLYLLGNYTQAIEAYSNENTKTSKLQIARAYDAIGNYEKAIKNYENLIARDSLAQIPRFELGKLYLKTKKYQAAKRAFQSLTLSKNPSPAFFYYLGLTSQKLDKVDESMDCFKSAIRTDSTHLRSLFQLAKFHVGSREKNKALEFIEKGLAYYPNDVALLNLKALTFYHNDEYGEAKELFERLIMLGEEKEHVFEKLGYCYLKLWEFEKAHQAYRTLAYFDNARAKAYYGLAETFWKQKQVDSAEVYFKKAIEEKKPFLGNEYWALGTLARGRNDLKAALDYYQKAYAEDISNAFVYYQICTTADQYYKDAETKLELYEGFLKKFGDQKNYNYLVAIAKKRARELKEEIHFAQE